LARGREAEYTSALGAIPLFEGLSKKELQFIAGVTSEVRVKAGSTLVKQGEPGQEAMVIESGTGLVKRDGVEVDTIGPGDVFGEMGLIVNQPRNATVEATSDMTVLVMDSREFSSVLSKYPDVAVKILKTVVARLIKAQEDES
jgi:CRP/FNR family transcriptional regulator, cyclic AMP receptor protein